MSLSVLIGFGPLYKPAKCAGSFIGDNALNPLNANGSSVDSFSNQKIKFFNNSLPTSFCPLSIAGTSP